MVVGSPRPNLKKMIKELVKGKESAVQLQTLLQQQPQIADHAIKYSDSSAQELVHKIWTSFTEALSQLTSCDSKGDYKQVVKHQRGCYKRRKNSDSWMSESEKMEDGYAWRKYGQKVILNSKNPRCYYRCAYKYNQDCRATKQVQIIKEDPIIHQTTYFGHHVCKRPQMEPQHQITSQSSYLTVESPSFEAKLTHDNTTTKEEEEEEESKEQSDDDVYDNISSTPISDLMLQDHLTLNSPYCAGAIMADRFSFEHVVGFHDLDMDDFSRLSDFDHLEPIEFS